VHKPNFTFLLPYQLHVPWYSDHYHSLISTCLPTSILASQEITANEVLTYHLGFSKASQVSYRNTLIHNLKFKLSRGWSPGIWVKNRALWTYPDWDWLFSLPGKVLSKGFWLSCWLTGISCEERNSLEFYLLKNILYSQRV